MKRSNFLFAAAFALAIGGAFASNAKATRLIAEGFQGTPSSCHDIGQVACNPSGSTVCLVNGNTTYQSGCSTPLMKN